jgi:hypothetical protein
MTEPRRPKALTDESIEEFTPEQTDETAAPYNQNGVPPPIGSIPFAKTGAPDPSEYDPFDPKNMHVPTDFRAALGVKKALTELACRKPAREWWFTVHPTDHVNSYFIELKETRELYYVAPSLWSPLSHESTLTYQRLYLCLTRQDRPFFWPVKLPGEDGKLNEWAQSAHDAALRGQGAWIRVQADMHHGHYQVLVADLPVEVTWPDFHMKELLRICFKDRLVDRMDHAILRQLLHCEG